VAGILALWMSGFCAAAEQDEAETTEEIIVAATPLPRGVEEIGRPVEIVTREQIEASGAASVSEILERFTSVSVSERGNWLVQSDLSIRASVKFPHNPLTLRRLTLTL
jgi:outer membrane cobalamin receptor